jgi:acetyl esterase/lipase
MHLPKRIAASAAGLVLAAVPAAASLEHAELERLVPVPADQPIPLTDFLRPNHFSRPQINRAGTYVAALASTELDTQDLMLVDLETGTADELSADVTQDVFSCDWLTDDRILFGTIWHKEYASQLRVAEVAHPGASYPVVRRSAVFLVGIPRSNPLRPILWLRGDAFSGDDEGAIQIDALEHLDHSVARRRTTRYMLNAQADVTMIKVAKTFPPPPSGIAAGYLTDKDGELAFEVDYENGAMYLNRLVRRHWERCPVDLDQVDVIGPGDKPGELIVVGPREPGRPRPVQRLDAETGRLGEVLYRDRQYDFYEERLYRDPGTGIVLGLQFNHRRPESVWFSKGYRSLQRRFEQEFPGKAVVIVGSDELDRRFLVHAYSDVDPGGYYLVELGRRSVKLLGKTAPWMDPARMRPMLSFSYRARDGSVVDGYLTLPAGAAKGRPAPLVVFPHGGPWTRDVWGYNPWVQLLANRGYAVFQPNYRGSLGYDWRFPEGDRYDFIKMSGDVTDGVQALIESGLVDRRRVAIMGASFGGYLALCGAVFEPGLYRCAITLSGIFDWAQAMAESRNNNYFEDPEFLFLKRHLGDPEREKAKFDAISPLRHVDRVRIPIFVYHGGDDQIASIDESKRLVGALEDNHVPFEKHFLENEEHGLSHYDDAVEIFTAIDAFLARNMGAQ